MGGLRGPVVAGEPVSAGVLARVLRAVRAQVNGRGRRETPRYLLYVIPMHAEHLPFSLTGARGPS
jgi:hypothetical protein